MYDDKHLAELKEGVEAWNQWRKDHPDVKPDLSNANLLEAKLSGANLSEADLAGADLRLANLSEADLHGADFRRAELGGANLRRAELEGANLQGANLRQANLHDVNLSGANLSKADLVGSNLSGGRFQRANIGAADLSWANLSGADLSGANLTRAYLYEADLQRTNISGAVLLGANLLGANLVRANLSWANLSEAKLNGTDLRAADLSWANLQWADLIVADLTEADLNGAHLLGTNISGAVLKWANLSGAELAMATLVSTKLDGADLSGSSIHGISAWNVSTDAKTKQEGLVITQPDEPKITVDDLEVAQFIYLLLNNEKIRDVIDTITSKVVLILGRFTEERKAVLDALRENLRDYGLVPVMFDFEKPSSHTVIGTVSTLAHMARFVIADFTDSTEVRREVEHIVLNLVIPVQPLLLEGQEEPIQLQDYRKGKHWVLPAYYYRSQEHLLQTLKENVIIPAQAKRVELDSIG